MSKIRHTSHPLVLVLYISLSYWKWIDIWCHIVCCGPPQAIGSFLHNRIGDSVGDFPFLLGFGGMMYLTCSLLLYVSVLRLGVC